MAGGVSTKTVLGARHLQGLSLDSPPAVTGFSWSPRHC